MAIRVALNHKTNHRYARDVWLSPHVVRLHPAPHCRTPVVSYSLNVTPDDHFINWQQDPYSNRLARLVFPNKTRELTIEVDLIAELTVINPFDFFLDEVRRGISLCSTTRSWPGTGPVSGHGAGRPHAAGARVPNAGTKKVPTADYLVSLNQRLQQRIKYLIRLETGIQTPEQTLTLGSGSCRDTSWLLVQLLRQLGLAARFVSGYLIQLAPDVKSSTAQAASDKDFADLHAWAEVYLPGAGWIGLDPTSGLLAGEGQLAAGLLGRPVDRGGRFGVLLVRPRGDHGGRSRQRPCRPPAARAFRTSSLSACRSRGSRKIRASRSRIPTRNGRKSKRSGTRSMRTCGAATCG